MKKSGHQVRTYQGPSINSGPGRAHASVALGAAGKPTAIGIKLSEQVLKDLPAELPPGADRWDYKLTLPAEATDVGYDHIVVDWNPKGHVPQGVYDIAHFDFHFYLRILQWPDDISGTNSFRIIFENQTSPNGSFTCAGKIRASSPLSDPVWHQRR